MRTLSIVASVLLATAFFVGDVIDLPAAQAVPVSADVQVVDVSGVDSRAVRAEGVASRPDELPADGAATDSRPEVLTGEVGTQDFAVLGITWDPASVPADAAVVSVRVREGGDWSDWEVLGVNDTGPDPGTDEARRARRVAATEPLAATGADAVQVRIDTSTGEVPEDVQAVVIDPGASTADDPAARRGGARSTAGAVAGPPSIISRAQWGADERRRTCTSGPMATIRAAVVHHTAGTNDYGPGDSAALIRGIYAYHTGTLGWCDIGYNFLVDRYGQVFEGRGGGIASNVMGAHAGGFNEATFGISALGDFNTASAPDIMIEAIAGVVAWKLQGSFRDPLGTTQLTSAGGGTARYAAGQTVTLPVVMGHRDVGSTACPGANLYAALDRIRTRTAELIGAGLANPAVSTLSQPSSGSFRVTSGVLGDQSWQLSVTDLCTGAAVTSLSGSASRGSGVDAVWGIRRADGSAAPPGSYRLVLSSWSASGQASLTRAWSVLVSGSGPTSPTVGGYPAVQPGLFVPLTPARLVDTRETRDPLVAGDTRTVVVTGRGGVPAGGVSAVALNVTSACVAGTPASYLSVWPAGAAQPGTSSLNTVAGEASAALVVSAVGAGGAVNVYNDSGTTQLVVDVVGYYATGGAGSRYHPVAPRRLFDSRSAGGQLTDGSQRTVSLAGQAGTLGAGMTGAVLNVTVAGASAEGYVTVYPAASPRPTTSTVNLVPGSDVSNRTAVGLDDNAFAIYLAGGPAHVVVDLVGFYATPAAGAGASYQPMTPARLLDTRSGLGGVVGPVGAGAEVSLAVAGVGGVPADATSVVLTLTGDGATAVTYSTVWPQGQARPNTSDLNLRAGRTRANTVVVDLGTDGQVRLYNDRGSAQLIVDVVGYFH